MGWFGRIFIAANVVAAWALCAYIVSRGFETGAKYTSAELITIVLAALAVMIAVLTIFLAVLALWGYKSLREVARETASQVAKETAEEIAGRTVRTLQDQEVGQGSGDEYANAAIGSRLNGAPDGS